MYRSTLFANFARLARIVRDAERAEERRGRPLEPPRIQRIDRREWLAQAGRTAAATAVAAIVPSAPIAALPRRRQNVSVGIVGAGLAGLACADALARGRHRGDRLRRRRPDRRPVLDAARVLSRARWPSAAASSSTRRTRRCCGTRRRFGLALEDVTKEAGETCSTSSTAQHVPEAVVVDAVPRVRPGDARRSAAAVGRSHGGSAHTAADVAVDSTSLAAYLDGANGAGVAAGPVIAKAAITSAYLAEYGLETDRAELPELAAVHPRRPALEVHAVRRLQRRALSRGRRQRRHRRRADVGARRAGPSSA